ncbi:class II aldolase/adducin family protein [Neorhizobium sp. Rsf11]|uniref:Class II aldolase/adducin family protein n=2 Tax=Neorhizobium TaxID=1525371 RepID=A0ABV0LX36_9HYPH|nr:class II aldolase/adducin family protein [Neorhizobium petrolearium]MCC2611191.1 class II aldolase/adducin family protein [Neorhizobium petrolearium]WGI66399.1 class II aldolase/adducin family protein [Neorhizobium petrolearium]
MSEIELRRSLLDVVGKLEAKGFNHGSSGNVSCRIGDDILITPTGGNSANMTPERLVRLDRDGETVGEGVPSSEWHMHLAILNAYPQVRAVVHTHADSCVALSCLAKPIPAFHYMIASFGGNDVPCAPYATFGTRALADGAVAALKDRKACLLANHGMIVAAHSLQLAFDLTVKLETLARQYILACQAGQPAIIPDEEIERVLERYKGYGRSRLPG